MLPSDELAELRAVQERALPDTCTIQTPTQTNTKGSVALTYANTYTGVPCRLAQSNQQPTERVVGAAMASVTDHVLTLPYDQAIEPSYRVVHNGITYEVIACPNKEASWLTARRAYLKLVK